MSTNVEPGLEPSVGPSLERQSDIDIGYDNVFERRWSYFERFVWAFFSLLIAATLLGLLGRGPLNRVRRTLADGTTVEYERVVRFKSPSMITFVVPVKDGSASIQPS